MPTRDLANKRITIWIGAANAIADLSQPTAAELAAMLMCSPAIRWDGLDFGAQASDQVDDRSLDDDAGAVERGFAQFGGSMPFFLPKATDSTSILRQAFNLLKVDRTRLAIVERVGFKSTSQAGAAGDNVNTYLAMVDGFAPDTEGTGGYVGLFNMIPQGETYPWTKVKNSPADAITALGGSSITAAADDIVLRGASLSGDNITARGTWTSDDPDVAEIVGPGIIKITGSSTDTTDVHCDFPGATTLDIAVTVS